MNKIIDEEKEKYCLPIFSINHIKETYNDLTFSINDDTFLEMLFLRIRGETIKFASTLKKKQNSHEKTLLQGISNLETTAMGQSNSCLLEDKKLNLRILEKKKLGDT